MLRQLDDATVVDEQGRYIFVSEAEFIRLTKNPDVCFVCLTAPSSETKEHIVPNWAIKHCGLANATIGLANGQKVPYPQYKIPCCEACNQALQHHYEKPISKAVKLGFKGLKNLHWSDPTLLIRWLNLLYFKTHYNDLSQYAHLDRRKGQQKIGEKYDWGVWNLPHALFRAPIYGTTLKNRNLGSLCVFKLVNQGWAGAWDYMDDHVTGAVYVRINDIALLAILQDGGIANAVMDGRYTLDRGAYVGQSLEVYTDYQVFYNELITKPDYVKKWELGSGKTEIRVDLPKRLDRVPHDADRRHKLLWAHLQKYSDLSMNDGSLLIDLKERILRGEVNLGLKPQPKSFPTDKQVLKKLKRSVIGATFHGL